MGRAVLLGQPGKVGMEEGGGELHGSGNQADGKGPGSGGKGQVPGAEGAGKRLHGPAAHKGVVQIDLIGEGRAGFSMELLDSRTRWPVDSRQAEGKGVSGAGKGAAGGIPVDVAHGDPAGFVGKAAVLRAEEGDEVGLCMHSGSSFAVLDGWSCVKFIIPKGERQSQGQRMSTPCQI